MEEAHRPAAVVHGDVGVDPGVDGARGRADGHRGRDQDHPRRCRGVGEEADCRGTGGAGEEPPGPEAADERPVAGADEQVAAGLGDEQHAEGGDGPVEVRPHGRPGHPERPVREPEGGERDEGETVEVPPTPAHVS